MSSSVVHSRFGAKSGLLIDRSTDVVLKLAGIKYVCEESLRIHVLVCKRKSSTILPLISGFPSLPQRGLWALKSPRIIYGLGS